MAVRTITLPVPILVGSTYALAGPINNLDVVYFKVSPPKPPAPTVKAIAGDRFVNLSWTP